VRQALDRVKTLSALRGGKQGCLRTKDTGWHLSRSDLPDGWKIPDPRVSGSSRVEVEEHAREWMEGLEIPIKNCPKEISENKTNSLIY
jgi:hypothetical protein